MIVVQLKVYVTGVNELGIRIREANHFHDKISYHSIYSLFSFQ